MAKSKTPRLKKGWQEIAKKDGFVKDSYGNWKKTANDSNGKSRTLRYKIKKNVVRLEVLSVVEHYDGSKSKSWVKIRSYLLPK